jgi:hypothetical protein
VSLNDHRSRDGHSSTSKAARLRLRASSQAGQLTGIGSSATSELHA